MYSNLIGKTLGRTSITILTILNRHFSNRTDRTYKKDGHRKAEIRFGFPEWPTAEITGTHIRELTRFQCEISAELRRSSQTSRVNPGSSIPKMYEVLEVFLYFTIYHSHRHLTGIVLKTSELSSTGRQIPIRNLRSSKFLARYDEATFTKSLLISNLWGMPTIIFFFHLRLVRIPMPDQRETRNR